MKKILSLVLVLMLCIGVIAMAEAPTTAPTTEPTKVPSPSGSPTRVPDPTRAPTRRPTPSKTESPSTETEAPATTEAPEDPVEAEIVLEGATVVVASAEEIKELLKEAKNVTTLFANNDEALLAVLGRTVMSATIATIRFDNLTPGQDVPFKTVAPAGFSLKDGDAVVVIIGIKDAYGAYAYKPVVGAVKGGKIEFAFTYEMANAIQSSQNTQLMFFKA